MPIDPSIIGNVMAPQAVQLPDVNAMTQTQTRGLENVYKIEMARQEQAKQAQQEQQAAIAQAMLPSVAAAFSDPSDNGLAQAAQLMPPEVADTFAPFMDRLRGVPDVNLRKSLLRAELMKDDEGRLILAQLEPTANMRLQADTAAGSQALRARELSLEEKRLAAGEKMTPYQQAQIEIEREKLAAAQDKPMPGKVDVKAAAKADDTLDKILSAYKKLNDLSAITSTKRTGVENLAATVSAKTGSTIGAAVGSEAQTQRQIIKNLRQALLNDIKAATGMSSKAIDSNVELQAFLNSLGDPENQSYEAAVATIGELSAKYAGGRLSGTAEEMLRETPQTKPAPGAIPQITTDEEFDALPSGAEFIDPEGVRRRKP